VCARARARARAMHTCIFVGVRGKMTESIREENAVRSTLP